MAAVTLKSEQIDQALRLVASRRLAATSALQRWMHIPFSHAATLLDELEQRGYVGPADGSKDRTIHVQCCEQCGRIGKRDFRTLADKEHDIEITECANRAACRKRWPKPARDDA
ncbi:DNA translocase FtsK [Streptomyces sp. NPDC056192]|uniref:DNA translocase FtsK n=1 Tax=Streptomyces sp. NPDC056192 TaxID=3345743 RepID=UPI0035E2392B